MAELYNPYSNQNKSDADYNIAYGTADRMNFSLCKVDAFFELRDYLNVMTQLEILFNEISSFESNLIGLPFTILLSKGLLLKPLPSIIFNILLLKARAPMSKPKTLFSQIVSFG